VRKKTAAAVANWTPTDAILDTWAQTLDALKNSPPGTTARATRIDFGGIFGIGEHGSFNNAIGGGQGCPAGYTPYEFKGTFNVDWPTLYCGRITGDGELPERIHGVGSEEPAQAFLLLENACRGDEAGVSVRWHLQRQRREEDPDHYSSTERAARAAFHRRGDRSFAG